MDDHVCGHASYGDTYPLLQRNHLLNNDVQKLQDCTIERRPSSASPLHHWRLAVKCQILEITDDLITSYVLTACGSTKFVYFIFWTPTLVSPWQNFFHLLSCLKKLLCLKIYVYITSRIPPQCEESFHLTVTSLLGSLKITNFLFVQFHREDITKTFLKQNMVSFVSSSFAYKIAIPNIDSQLLSVRALCASNKLHSSD